MILISALTILVAFFALAVITEHFFVPAIDRLANKLNMSSDASGATLLAMGSSAPEFFTVLVAVLAFSGGEHANVGAGAVVGSALFNILVIVGLAALYKTVHLQWKIVARDILFYSFTILFMLVAFWDGMVTLPESLSFLGLFTIYVFCVVNWRKWITIPPEKPIKHIPESTNPLVIYSEKTVGYVIPNPEIKPRAYPITFVMSIAAIAGISWVLVNGIVNIADALSINATFLGLTVLAAGTSVPDLIGSIVVARQGRGDMAVSNAIGSNVFDILFGLGMPWFIAINLRGQDIVVAQENLSASVLLLFASVIVIIFLLISQRFKIGNKSGLFLIALYFGYCAYIALSVFSS